MATENDLQKLRRKYPKRLTRGRAIKLYCKELCCCGDNKSWKECTLESCFLWPFRTGREQTPEKTKTQTKKGNMLSKNKEKKHSQNTSQSKIKLSEKQGSIQDQRPEKEVSDGK